MIINDLQRLRWQILDEALRDPVMEYFMGERTKTNETGNTRSLIYHVNQRLKSFNRLQQEDAPERRQLLPAEGSKA